MAGSLLVAFWIVLFFYTRNALELVRELRSELERLHVVVRAHQGSTEGCNLGF